MSYYERITGEIRNRLPERSVLIERAKQSAFILVLFIGLYIVGIFLPPGFDWKLFFSQGYYPEFWMPWTKPIVALFNYPAIFALTVLSMGLRTYRYKPSPLAVLLVFISLPTLWMFFLGNVDGLAIFGLLILPWGAPLVLIKPQVASFALLARRSSLIITIVCLLLSFVIWGPWPLTWLKFFTPEWDAEWVQDISIFPWGLIVALPMLWFSRGDEDLLMAAGSLCSPHLFPYHFIALVPALARMRWPWMLATWVITWTPFLSNWYGDWAWHFGNLMSVFFWLGIYFGLPPEARQQRNAIIRQGFKFRRGQSLMASAPLSQEATASDVPQNS